MRIKRNRYYKKSGNGVLKALVVVAVLGGASFCLAFIWQNAQQGMPGLDPASSDSAEPPHEALPAAPSEEEAKSVSAPSVPQSEASETSAREEAALMAEEVPGGESESAADKPAAAPGAVPESPKVDNSYFADAIFFGDSISTGIPLYKVAGNPDTVAFTGINPDTINTSEVIVTPDGKKTMLEAAKQYGDKKRVYIMLGANGLWMDEKSFAAGYQTFISAVKEQYPDAVIYLQSILPVTAHAKDKYETADNDVIRGFNEQIQALARSNGVFYVDVAHALMDENGALPDEASPTDGMHLTPEYYAKWFEYLKTHTVEEN